MLNFRKFENEDTELIRTWLSKDDVGMKFLPSYAKTEDYSHLIDFNKRFLWIVLEDDRPVGFFDFEKESVDLGYFAFYLAPEFRGKGLAHEILRQGLDLSEVRNIKLIKVGVEKENLASIRLLERVGFTFISTDKDGMLIYQSSS